MTPRRLTLYDTTLRDGAQGEGISFSGPGRVALARRLDAFGVDYIEGGYAGANASDMAFFREMRGKPLRRSRLVAFGSTRRAHTKVRQDPLLRSLLETGTPCVAVYGKAWRLHVSDVLRTTAAENLAMVADTIGWLKDRKREVFFDAEHFFDGYRDDPAFALSVIEAAARAGADCMVLCDTNGGSLPQQVAEAVRAVRSAVRVPIAIHAHDDMGLALANSIEAVRAGAEQIQGTMNGFGERCGNANLCAVLPTLTLKMGHRVRAGANLAMLTELSRFADDVVNRRSDPRMPYVGANAFAHKAGPHANAVGKNPRTYEHVAPAKVGNDRRLLVSELAGTSSVLLKAIELGVGRQRTAEGMREVLAALKQMEARGYAFEAADASFHILVQKVLKEHRSFFDLDGYRVVVEKRAGDGGCLSEATVKVRVNGEAEQTVAEGDGPVNALDKALRKALIRFYPVISKVALTDFRVRILDPEEATAAKTRVLIESTDGEETWGTVGVSENIIEASWEALVDSVEYKLFRDEERRRAGSRRGRSRRRAG
jgi:2-isopropylmalate synthase